MSLHRIPMVSNKALKLYTKLSKATMFEILQQLAALQTGEYDTAIENDSWLKIIEHEEELLNKGGK